MAVVHYFVLTHTPHTNIFAPAAKTLGQVEQPGGAQGDVVRAGAIQLLLGPHQQLPLRAGQGAPTEVLRQRPAGRR